MQNINDERNTNIIIEGAGTGKTIIAIFYFKILSSQNGDFSFRCNQHEEECRNLLNQIKNKFPKMRKGLVIPMSSFRKTIKKVFTSINGLNQHMVMGPSEITKNEYDLLVVDESHRLRRRVNLTNYKAFDDSCKRLGLDKDTHSELDWVLKQSKFSILFYDQGQSIKPTDVSQDCFDILKDDDKSKF